MEDQSTEPKKYSYPNADRSPSDQYVTEESVPTRPTIHLSDAIQQKHDIATGEVVKNIRTFQSDVADAVHSDNISMIKIALAEKKRKDRQGTFDEVLTVSHHSRRILLILAGIAVLTVVGLSLYAAFGNSSRERASVTDAQTSNSSDSSTGILLQAEKNTHFDVTGKFPDQIAKLVQDEKTVDLPLGSVTRLILTATSGSTTTPLDSNKFLTALRSRTSDSLLRSINDEFILGVYARTPDDSFLLFSIRSYDNAYAGMLEWEPYMEHDIGGIIINQSQTLDQTDLTTSTANSAPSVFVDRVVNNKDSRVMFNSDGSIKMLYSFLDKNTLVIASSPDTLKEVLFRLTTGRISR